MSACTTPANNTLSIGFDVGSTTVKAVVLDQLEGTVLFREYKRHGARQAQALAESLETIAARFPGARFRCAITGSGAAPLADTLGVPFIQEVVANSIAIRRFHPQARTAIELGGQDAKMIFFSPDPHTGTMTVSDMRMNGSCAGGTGAFVDEIANLLRIPVEEFNASAEQGTHVYDISGRCGVYAKTDIQPLLNQGVAKEDLALSTFHAIAKQTIGGLAQGLDIEPPVVFEGGPLTFNPRLVQVFAERLELSGEDVLVPQHPETIVALGAALSLGSVFEDRAADLEPRAALAALENCALNGLAGGTQEPPFFASLQEQEEFQRRHRLPNPPQLQLEPGSTLRAYLGIDCGSTTTKFVLWGEDDRLLDSFYAHNEGEPLDVARNALLAMHQRYRERGVELKILGAGTTGYGELLMKEAFDADYHVVETVAHATAARSWLPDASFILDIGGQDMKAIWLDGGVVTNIVVNEACSSGCGSFLENFASNLGIPTEQIAEEAFRSSNPAKLGSRCTVFMNSSIVTQQRQGKTPADIMAGLCRSIVENVFTKVIRLSNLDRLGDKIMVQGGTFCNDAVLRAFEEYVGREVMRAPAPGLMGAIGVAQLVKEEMEHRRDAGGALPASSFIGWDDLQALTYTQESNLTCPFCANHCNRSCIRFSNGESFVTGNRCPKGEVLGDPSSQEVRRQLKAAAEAAIGVPNLFEERKDLLFAEYPCAPLCPPRNTTIGIPRVLSFWDTAPFWTTFWRALGFEVKLSPLSTRRIYESGLHAVTSDTVCFPAKLVHGHIRSLVKSGVDRIFMPIITVVESEGTAQSAESMCAVVKGYPMVINNSDNPMRRWGVPFDAPLWHWYSSKDRKNQLCAWMKETFGIAPALTEQAIEQADAAQGSFRAQLQTRGMQVVEEVQAQGRYAVVLASRPYQNDDLVNHDLPKLFNELGIPVLTADSLPQIHTEDLSKSLLEIANNYHARMLSTALEAAKSPFLEYAQVVNFNCGHDAYLSDEIVRLMHEVSGKSPLVLKLDESDIAGPLRIRVRSFVETVNTRRRSSGSPTVHELEDPYHSKFTRDMRAGGAHEKTVLVPNTSHAFSMLMTAAFRTQGLRAESLPVGREDAIRLGKRYVHNDICFPCQIVIGEALSALESGAYDPDEVAIGMGKYVGDCRLTHYTALLRKALDDAGYPQVPIITNDDVDSHNVHPGYTMSLPTAMRIAYGLPMVDALEELLRKIRPYELEPGSTQTAFDKGLQLTMDGLEAGGIAGMKKGFAQAIELMRGVAYDRSTPRPRVLIVGEYLLNFHPGSNHDIERYLEDNGMEVIEARMTDVIRKSYFYKDAQVKEYKLDKPLSYKALFRIENNIFNLAHSTADKIACAHPLYKPAARMQDIVKASDPIVHHTFDAGEGVLIPAEILHHASQGCRSFIILQPFGCLPNHVVGRGISKRLKELYPDAQILPLDYDPDVAPANIENRLQMLIMDAKAKHE
ncbi:MAG: acyl-CoA dehydratase activase [Coriobacteriales bacterium]